MSLKKINKDDLEVFTIKTRPHRLFLSSSEGTIGAIKTFVRDSKIEKESNPYNYFEDARINNDIALLDVKIQDELNAIKGYYINSGSGADFNAKLDSYMGDVNKLKKASKNDSTREILRLTPTFTFTKNTNIKNVIRKTLVPYYRVNSSNYDWGYTNYFSLNFFNNDENIRPILMYPDDTTKINGSYQTGNFVLTSSFTFDFYINPRRTSAIYNPGTVFHLSGCYAVSIISGSSKDGNGCPDAFRIMLQLKDGTHHIPTAINTNGTDPTINGSSAINVFLSDDNSLPINDWHHVVIRWGTSTINNGDGEIIINGENKGIFSVPSSSIAPIKGADESPNALFIGNFYSGSNTGVTSISKFFNNKVSTKEGIKNLINDDDEPQSASFSCGLDAEIHDLCIKNYYVTDYELNNQKNDQSVLDNSVFYLPPFFIPESPFRKTDGNSGGIFETPFQMKEGTSSTPFNTTLSFGVGGHYMNIENFVYDFASKQWPRLYNLITEPVGVTLNEAKSCNDILYSNEYEGLSNNGTKTTYRNLFVLPCDDGRFRPNHSIIKTTSDWQNKIFKNDFGILDNSFISLNNYVSESLIKNQFDEEQSGISKDNGSPDPDNLTNIDDSYYSVSGKPLYPILQRTKDNSSNQIVIFDVSNLYYGNKIFPKTLKIKDRSMRGSLGKVCITLVDDGHGNIYRNDSKTNGPTWSSVGNVYYNEGLIVLKDPSLFFFGYDNFEISFDGEYNIHTLKMNILVGANEFNSSSNPAYKDVPASNKSNDSNQNFVYITGINYHDDNLNVVARTIFAQPIVKRRGEKFLIKNRIDF